MEIFLLKVTTATRKEIKNNDRKKKKSVIYDTYH